MHAGGVAATSTSGPRIVQRSDHGRPVGGEFPQPPNVPVSESSTPPWQWSRIWGGRMTRSVVVTVVVVIIHGDASQLTYHDEGALGVARCSAGNRPGARRARCAKAYRLQRITGGPDVFTVEAVGDYGGQRVYVTSIIEFRHSKIVKQTDYFANAFEAPGWCAKWVQPMDRV